MIKKIIILGLILMQFSGCLAVQASNNYNGDFALAVLDVLQGQPVRQ